MPRIRVSLLFVVLLVLSASLFGQESSPLLLRGNHVAVQAMYDDFTTRDAEDVRERYVTLPAQMKTDLWLLQLERYLAVHHDLTVDQRAAIYEGIGILSSGVMDVSRSAPEWEAQARLPLQHLETSARAAFDPVTFKRLFQRMGLDELVSSPHQKLRAISNAYCECSSESDWCCPYPTCPEYCHSAPGYRCTFTPDGCGTFLWYACTGLCG